ncbi:hypothetical protein [Lacrimispora amygdalina]|uniref:hypothetical protein n=1 Tax=Lacrimispora amygdalina TaxID=253257 RepID=UPI000BE34A24|nr:hypothetical protein [Lacrimispora amygdalina]
MIKEFCGEKVIKLKGFKIDDEIILDDSASIGNCEKVSVNVTPSMIKFWISENTSFLEKIGVSILDIEED